MRENYPLLSNNESERKLLVSKVVLWSFSWNLCSSSISSLAFCFSSCHWSQAIICKCCMFSFYLLVIGTLFSCHSLTWLVASQILISLLFNCISLFSPISSFSLLFVANFYIFLFSIHLHWSFAITSLMLGNFLE